MHVGRTKPITKRLIGWTSFQKGCKVAPNLTIEFFFGIVRFHSLTHQLRHVLRKLIEATTRFLERKLLPSVWCVSGRAWTPNLIRFSDVITSIFQKQRISRNRFIPNCSSQNRPATSSPEILTGQQRTATRRTRRSIHVSIAEENTSPCYPIEIRSLHHIVDAAGSIRISINTGVASPVVGEKEQDVRPLWFCSGQLLNEKEYQAMHHQRHHGRNERTALKSVTNEHSANPPADGNDSTRGIL